MIEGCQYSIQQAQNLNDTIPKCTQLTLVQPDILLDFDQKEGGACGRF